MSRVAEVAATGETRATLEAMRDGLAEAFDSAPDTVKAQIAARLESVVMRIAALPEPKKESKSDELARRRAARRAEAAVHAPAAGEN